LAGLRPAAKEGVSDAFFYFIDCEEWSVNATGCRQDASAAAAGAGVRRCAR
jgi:hypothetical protein